MGWRGSARHWKRYESAYLLLAGLATPLVLSVHTVVSFDFAVSILPGWHTTVFPPYFVAGAIYSGFAMVLVLAIPIRRFYGVEDMITMRHLDNAAKVMLGTGLIVAYGYVMEAFYAYYSGNFYEQFMIRNRMLGPMAWSYWCLILFNILIPQLLWIRKVRLNPAIAVRHLAGHSVWHVAGALRDRGHQPASRLSAIVVGIVRGRRAGTTRCLPEPSDCSSPRCSCLCG